MQLYVGRSWDFGVKLDRKPGEVPTRCSLYCELAGCGDPSGWHPVLAVGAGRQEFRIAVALGLCLRHMGELGLADVVPSAGNWAKVLGAIPERCQHGDLKVRLAFAPVRPGESFHDGVRVRNAALVFAKGR